MPDQGVQTVDQFLANEEVVLRWQRLAYALRESRPLNQGRRIPEDWDDMDHRMQTLELEVKRLRFLLMDVYNQLATMAGST